MKIAYKGFDAELKCRGVQFQIGFVYEKQSNKEVLKTCTDDGYHYCNNLEDVFRHYSRGGINRFCLIEVLGKFTDDPDGKSITNSFKIIRELSAEDWRLFDKNEVEKNKLKEESIVEEVLNLDLVRELQTRYPILHVAGSTALYLHGVRLKRFTKSNWITDIDFISPYFFMFDKNIEELVEDKKNDDDIFGIVESKLDLSKVSPLKQIKVTYKNAKASGNDFDETFMVEWQGKTVKVDYKIDPKQRYEIINYKGFDYKVSAIENILAAKLKYAMNGQEKHKQDIYEMVGKIKR